MKKLILVAAMMVAGSANATWIVFDTTDPITDEPQVVAFTIAAFQGVSGPRLTFKCENGELEGYINWHEYFTDGSHKVTWRVDKGEVHSSQWRVSTDNTALFSRSPQQLFNALKGGESLTVRATPYGESTATLSFFGVDISDHAPQFDVACPS